MIAAGRLEQAQKPQFRHMQGVKRPPGGERSSGTGQPPAVSPFGAVRVEQCVRQKSVASPPPSRGGLHGPTVIASNGGTPAFGEGPQPGDYPLNLLLDGGGAGARPDDCSTVFGPRTPPPRLPRRWAAGAATRAARGATSFFLPPFVIALFPSRVLVSSQNLR